MPRTIQLKGVPDDLYRQLKARAALAGLPLSDYLLRAVRRIVEDPTVDGIRERLRGREAYSGRVAAADLVRAERDGCR